MSAAKQVESGGANRHRFATGHKPCRCSGLSSVPVTIGRRPFAPQAIREQFYVILKCRDEQHQVELLERFAAEGADVRHRRLRQLRVVRRRRTLFPAKSAKFPGKSSQKLLAFFWVPSNVYSVR